MSPNPLQRKLLYKKTEIPFSLSDLKESIKGKTEVRFVQSHSLSCQKFINFSSYGNISTIFTCNLVKIIFINIFFLFCRSVEDSNSDHLIGRLDPWGVWLLRRGTDLVCTNQYRSVLPLLHPVTLNLKYLKYYM